MIYYPRAPMTAMFEGQSLKTRPFSKGHLGSRILPMMPLLQAKQGSFGL